LTLHKTKGKFVSLRLSYMICWSLRRLILFWKWLKEIWKNRRLMILRSTRFRHVLLRGIYYQKFVTKIRYPSSIKHYSLTKKLIALSFESAKPDAWIDWIFCAWLCPSKSVHPDKESALCYAIINHYCSYQYEKFLPAASQAWFLDWPRIMQKKQRGYKPYCVQTNRFGPHKSQRDLWKNSSSTDSSEGKN